MRLELGIARVLYDRGEGDWPTLYVGRDRGAVFITFFPRLHTGWQSYPKVFWNKRGWEYMQPALLVGSQKTSRSRWFKFPMLLVPARLYDLWMMRHRSYRDARRADMKQQAGDAVPSNDSNS